MNILLILFAIPIAVIIFSIALQKIFRCPFLVAGIIFAIFLIVTFAVGDINLLIATIVYTIISFITAYITMLVSKCRQNNGNEVNNNNNNGGCPNANRRSILSCLCNRR